MGRVAEVKTQTKLSGSQFILCLQMHLYSHNASLKYNTSIFFLGSWFRASAITTSNKIQQDAQWS
jgi:hypothetical protein